MQALFLLEPFHQQKIFSKNISGSNFKKDLGKLGMVTDTYNPITREAESGKSQV
jgi:hypothetical protein